MAFLNEVTLYAIVRYDHIEKEHRIVALQSNAVDIRCSTGGDDNIWEVHSVEDDAVAESLFIATNANTADQKGGTISFTQDAAKYEGVDADPFVAGQSIKVRVMVPSTTGDSSSNIATAHDLTVHLRAISRRMLLWLRGDDAAAPDTAVKDTIVVSGGGTPDTGKLATKSPNSTGIEGSAITAWNTIHWVAVPLDGGTIEFDPPAGPETKVKAGVGSYRLELWDGPADNKESKMRARFGDDKPLKVIKPEEKDPRATIYGMEDEISVPGGVGEVVFWLTAKDKRFFSLSKVTIRISFLKNGAEVCAVNYSHEKGKLKPAPDANGLSAPSDVIIIPKEPVLDAANRSPIKEDKWPGLYPGAGDGGRVATWGTSSDPFVVKVPNSYSSVKVTIWVENQAGVSDTAIDETFVTS